MTDPAQTMHELQQQFASQEGEAAWTRVMHEHFHGGELDDAQEYLQMQLEALGTQLATRCLIDDPDRVSISGWEELQEAIELHEGEPITGVTLAIANETDRVFEKGQVHRPYMLLGLYCDEPYPFTRADRGALVAQAMADDGPAWAGYDEDIEVFLECEGLAAINTELVHHKERHFFRDEAPHAAPRRYVEYVLACWWRALLFHRAVEKICRTHPLPGAVRVVAGMVDMKPDAISVHMPPDDADMALHAPTRDVTQMADLLPEKMVVRREEEVVLEPPSGADLRRRVTASEPAAEPDSRKSLLGRIFGR